MLELDARRDVPVRHLQVVREPLPEGEAGVVTLLKLHSAAAGSGLLLLCLWGGCGAADGKALN